MTVVYVHDVVEQNSEPSSLRRNHFADGRDRYQWFWIGWAFCMLLYGLDGCVVLCSCNGVDEYRIRYEVIEVGI